MVGLVVAVINTYPYSLIITPFVGKLILSVLVMLALIVYASMVIEKVRKYIRGKKGQY